MKILQNNGPIVELDLRPLRLDEAMIEKLATALDTNTRLHTLGIPICNSAHLVQALSKHPSLVKLSLTRNLRENFFEAASDLMPVCDILRQNPRIKSLDLGSINVDEKGMLNLKEALGKNHGLKVLALSLSQLFASGAQHLAELIQNNPQLQILELSYIPDNDTQNSSEGIKAIARAVKNHPNLECIKFSNRENFKESDFECLLDAAQNNSYKLRYWSFGSEQYVNREKPMAPQEATADDKTLDALNELWAKEVSDRKHEASMARADRISKGAIVAVVATFAYAIFKNATMPHRF